MASVDKAIPKMVLSRRVGSVARPCRSRTQRSAAPRDGREEANRPAHNGSRADTEEAAINSEQVERPLRAAIGTVVAQAVLQLISVLYVVL